MSRVESSRIESDAAACESSSLTMGYDTMRCNTRLTDGQDEGRVGKDDNEEDDVGEGPRVL